MSGPERLELVAGSAPGAYRLEEQVGFALRRANQRHIAIFAAHIAELTPPQFAVLAKLHEVGETSQTHLGNQVAMDAATVKGVIDRLKTRGLVFVDDHKDDRRRIVVTLTQEGRRTVETLLPVAETVTAETLAPLGAREAATLMRLLGKLG